MSNKTVISFQKVSKSFEIDRQNKFRKKILSANKHKTDLLKVLRNISFDIQKGEAVGIMGPNGSGKSTILRLIASIILPDSGRVMTRGNIAPIIELGSGLHPELTGIDNIFLHGSLLGMLQPTIQTKLNKIISFSELSSFMNVPVKKYSSGMKARLAFSTAVFSNADIFLIDEILAVGDSSFREKCIKLIKKLKGNKTIIFTTHNIGLLQHICDRTFILERGGLTNNKNEVKITFLKSLPQDYEFIAKAKSNSMYPMVKKGDLLTLKKIKFLSIKKGDIIAFYLENLPEIIVHRVFDILSIKGKRKCITKGDNSFGLDSWQIDKNKYLGKVRMINNKKV